MSRGRRCLSTAGRTPPFPPGDSPRLNYSGSRFTERLGHGTCNRNYPIRTPDALRNTCKDGNPCTDDDQCDAQGLCQPGAPHECNPQDPCKKAWCNEAAKEGTNPCILEWKVEGVGCDDGDACTDGDLCVIAGDGPTLVCSGIPVDCNDNNPCTTDSCDTADGCQFKTKTDGSPCAEDMHWQCVSGECICVPSCAGKECGPDGCGQTCGACPAMSDCEDGICVCPYEICENTCCEFGQVCSAGLCCTPDCVGKNCGSDGCSGTCGTCPGANDVCQDGVCVCIPTCAGKECGSDGCAGSCGTCVGLAVCEAGQCVCPFETCGDSCCAFGDVCFGGQCCTPQCQGKECGDNACGGVCGNCPGPQYQCQSGQCVCVPSCVGKECGSDGCFGSCGSCGYLEVCSNGVCTCEYESCGSACCGAGEVCYAASCCAPNCAGKECGSDGCGGSCGSCPGAQYSCQNGSCICIPSCVGKECGTDGCGGSCGTCAWNEECSWSGQCACQPQCAGKECGPDSCGGQCSPGCFGQDSCQNGVCVCQPVCNGKDCGPNGCGGTCGSCNPGLSCVNGECILEGLVWKQIPGGSFQMGCSPGDSWCDLWDETPVHTVSISSFKMLETEVTQAQYQAVMGQNPSFYSGCGECPVEKVSLNDAESFCEAVGGRLPSEAEWEYAARGGTTNQYGCSGCTGADGVAWYSYNSGNQTQPVGMKPANSYGLRDMLGNVAEWVADCSHMGYQGAPTDGSVWTAGCGPVYDTWVIRGGNFKSYASDVRVSARKSMTPDPNSFQIGIRCAK